MPGRRPPALPRPPAGDWACVLHYSSYRDNSLVMIIESLYSTHRLIRRDIDLPTDPSIRPSVHPSAHASIWAASWPAGGRQAGRHVMPSGVRDQAFPPRATRPHASRRGGGTTRGSRWWSTRRSRLEMCTRARVRACVRTPVRSSQIPSTCPARPGTSRHA